MVVCARQPPVQGLLAAAAAADREADLICSDQTCACLCHRRSSILKGLGSTPFMRSPDHMLSVFDPTLLQGLLGAAAGGVDPASLQQADWREVPQALPTITLSFVFHNIVPVIASQLEVGALKSSQRLDLSRCPSGTRSDGQRHGLLLQINAYSRVREHARGWQPKLQPCWCSSQLPLQQAWHPHSLHRWL